MHKNYFKQFVLTVAMLLCNVVANAHDFEVDGIFYNFIHGTDNAVAVTYKGGNYAYYKNEYTGNVVIPDFVIYNGMSFRVTNIQGYAFHECSGLTSITIPDNVIIIGERAFFHCTGLKNVDMGASVTYIEACAFDGCSSLTSIELPTSLISLGHQVFLSCSSLTNIVIPDNVISIGFDTFGSCTNLKSITLSNSITSIEYAMFMECKSLANITIPNSVTTIGGNAFYGCTALTSITIPSSVKHIDVGVFTYCPKLASINVGHSNSRYDSRENCNAIIETRTNTLIAGCNNSIIPDNVICIGESAFCGSGLTHLVIPKSVTNIMDYAFSSCSELSSIIVERDNSRYDSRENCNAIIETKTNTLIAGCNNSIIPNDIRSIGKTAFSARTGLTNIAIPENVASIGRYAFSGCTSLADVTIGNGVASIEEGAFTNCPLKTLKCESKIPATLGKDVFSGVDLTSTILKVPAGSKDVYSNTDGWNDFWNIEEFYYDRYFYVNYIVDDLLFARDSIKHGAEVILIEAPTKEGHTFSGWSEAPSTMPAEDIIIRGSFTTNRYVVTYIVDGEVYASDSIAYGTALEPLAEPAKDGYTFSGWSEIPATMPAEDVTITGSFAVNSYLLTYIVDGEIYASDSIAYGTALEPLAEPAKDGYTFSGWSEIPDAMPAHDVTITGRFIANEKCATPIIGYKGGKLKICCDTEGAEFVTIITDSDITTHYNAEIELAATYNISAYATLAGYENSDIATATLCWIEKESVSTDIIEVMSSAVLITCKDGRINICCGQDGAEVLVYDINGTTIGSATIINGKAILDTSLLKGEIAIVNIAGKGIKVVMQ